MTSTTGTQANVVTTAESRACTVPRPKRDEKV